MPRADRQGSIPAAGLEQLLSTGYHKFEPGLRRRGEEAGCPLGVAKLVASSPLRIFASRIEHVIACTKDAQSRSIADSNGEVLRY
jgi:hypothetical protein